MIEDGEEMLNEGCITDTTLEFTQDNEIFAEISTEDEGNSGDCIEQSNEGVWTYLGDNMIESPAFGSEQAVEVQFEDDDRLLLPSPETEEDPYTQVLIRVE